MTKILFVDDEPLLLTAMSRGFRRDRDRWHMVFVGGADAALGALELESFDVVVSDLRMPGMDGATLLDHVRQKHRGTIRVMLSGNIEPTLDAMARTFAHEVLSKPCSIANLRACIERQLGCDKTSSSRFRAALRALSQPAPSGS
jgi:DNA-binding NtrC family response regulator